MNTLLQIDWSNLQTRIGGERLSNLLLCVVIILATLLVKKPLARLIARFIAKVTNKFTDQNHGKVFSDMLQKPFESLLQVILFYIAINQLNVLLGSFLLHRIKDKHEELAVRFGDIVDHVFLFLIIIYTTTLLSRIVDFVYHVQKQKATDDDNKERMQLLPIVKDVVKVLLWTIGIFWILGSVFHVNIPALITGLGIGGVAIALAAKESVENLFAAFTILTDKPFQVGDSIRLGTLEGKIERIGFRSTRLRTPDGSAFIIPNKKLVYENLENLSNRFSRRVKLVVNIKYGVAHTDLQALNKQLRHAMLHTLYVIEPVEILLDGFAENVFQLSVSYYVQEPLPSGAHLNEIKHEVNMNIYKIVSNYTSAAQITTPPAPQLDVNDADADGDDEG